MRIEKNYVFFLFWTITCMCLFSDEVPQKLWMVYFLLLQFCHKKKCVAHLSCCNDGIVSGCAQSLENNSDILL